MIADTAKTCVEIPCPSFVDDRLNVAALCLTSSLLQNRGYPEFTATFTRWPCAVTVMRFHSPAGRTLLTLGAKWP